MPKSRKPRGIAVTSMGQSLLRQAKASRRNSSGKPITYEVIAEELLMDAKTVGRFLRGDPVDVATAARIINFFDLIWEDVIDTHGIVLEEAAEELREENEILRQKILKKENEIEKYQDQGDMMIAELDRLEMEKTDLEVQLRYSNEAIQALEKAVVSFKTRMNVHLKIASWIDSSRAGLAGDAAECVRSKRNSMPSNEKFNSSEEIELFSRDIRKYLYLISHSLRAGEFNLMRKAKIRLKLPLNLHKIFYIEALRFLNDEKFPAMLGNEEIEQVKPYLDFLLELLRD